jgi:glycosyltransferase involved in cell wall biosynthesis
MNVLMLGWEYPPHISGGLGTACEGLTTGLARHNVGINFVVPHFFGGESAPHMQLVDTAGSAIGYDDRGNPITRRMEGAGTAIKTTQVPAALSPYWTPESYEKFIATIREQRASGQLLSPEQLAERLASRIPVRQEGFQQYGRDIFAEVARYASRVVSLFSRQPFDAIHAHDWMTYPAGVALSELTGKPLVVHIHSLEYDRSGAAVNKQIFDIEKWGAQAADAVIAVSYYTRSMTHQQYSVPLQKIHVVHNGIYPHQVIQNYRREHNLPAKVVLFLGRITFQKGPDYFVEAAAKVVPHVPDVVFVMAGSGDMLQRMVDRVNALGIGRHFYFPGFLKGQEVEEMFSLADVYVMPSVSEPFGISALEAINYDTPVIISKQSGVSEVLGHALKVDFWDIDRLADLIINALLHDELRADMVSMAREEVKRLHWDAAALKTLEIYRTIAH